MDKVKMIWSKTNRWHRGLLIFILLEMKVLPAGQRGFICNDPALTYKFNGDTVNIKHLFGTILLIPLAMMLIIERKYHRDVTVKPKKLALRWYKEYIFGLLLNLIAVQGLKLAVGAPRPHFFDTCDPNEAMTCQGSEFVSFYTCSKPQYWSRESTKSFPSGHSSLAVHAGVFLAYYLYKRAPRSNIVNICHAALLAATVYCGVSRMLDHRHHWWDVVAGAIIALPILAYIIYYLCRNFEAPSESKAPKSDLNNVDQVNESNIAPLIGTNQNVHDR